MIKPTTPVVVVMVLHHWPPPQVAPQARKNTAPTAATARWTKKRWTASFRLARAPSALSNCSSATRRSTALRTMHLSTHTERCSRPGWRRTKMPFLAIALQPRNLRLRHLRRNLRLRNLRLRNSRTSAGTRGARRGRRARRARCMGRA